MGLSVKPARLNPPCKPTLALFVFMPFEITIGPLLFSIIAGAEVEAGGFPDALFTALKRSIGVLLEIKALLLKVVKPTEFSVTPTPIDRAVVRVV